MIRRLLPGFVALAGLLLGSCYPVDEHPQRRTGPRRSNANPPSVAHNDQVMPQALPEQPTATGASPRLQPPATGASPRPQPPATGASPRPQPAAARPEVSPIRKPPPEPPPRDVAPESAGRNYPVAKKAPGRDGYVLSPYTSKLMFVRGIPSGTVVPDQTSPASPQKFFVVP